MKLPRKENLIFGLLLAIVVFCLILSLGILNHTPKNQTSQNSEVQKVLQEQAVEGFQNELKTAEEIETALTDRYASNLEGKTDEELRQTVANLRLRMNKFGLYPGSDSPDLSKYALKSELRPEDQEKCTVSVAEDRDKYMAKSDVPPPPPKIDVNKYVLKSSIPPEKVCPPKKEIDYSKYVLKSTLPPSSKCPACICPKVKVSAGLCKKCPPPPKCPEPEPCPIQKCPEVQACPAAPTCPEPAPCPTLECPKLHTLKEIKVPVVIVRTIKLDAQGNVVSQTEEKQEQFNQQTARQQAAQQQAAQQQAKQQAAQQQARQQVPSGAPTNKNDVATSIGSSLSRQSNVTIDGSVQHQFKPLVRDVVPSEEIIESESYRVNNVRTQPNNNVRGVGSRSLSGQRVNNLNNNSAYNRIYGNLNSINNTNNANNTDNTRAGNNLQCGASTNLNTIFGRHKVKGFIPS